MQTSELDQTKAPAESWRELTDVVLEIESEHEAKLAAALDAICATNREAALSVALETIHRIERTLTDLRHRVEVLQKGDDVERADDSQTDADFVPPTEEEKFEDTETATEFEPAPLEAETSESPAPAEPTESEPSTAIADATPVDLATLEAPLATEDAPNVDETKSAEPETVLEDAKPADETKEVEAIAAPATIDDLAPEYVDLVRRLSDDPDDEAAIADAYALGQQNPAIYATMLGRVGERISDPEASAYWLSEGAKVWHLTLQDLKKAASLLLLAVGRQPLHAAMFDALAALYEQMHDRQGLVAIYELKIRALEALPSHDPHISQQLSILYEDLGHFWQQPPDADPAKAIACLRKSFALDPSAIGAIYTCRELLKARGDFREALPLFEAEIAMVDDVERKVALYRDLAATCQEIGDLRLMSKAFRDALGLTPNDDSLEYDFAACIIALLSSGQPVEDDERAIASGVFLRLAEQFEGEHGFTYVLSALKATPTHRKALAIARDLAISLGPEKAIELDPELHRPTLEALVALCVRAKDWQQAIEYKQKILERLTDTSERSTMLQDIAHTAMADGDRNRTIEAFEAAAALEPENKSLLLRLFEVHQEIGDSEKMIEALERLANLDSDPESKAHTHSKIARIYRDKEADELKAIEHFDLALDLNPLGERKAFDAIRRILTRQGEWKSLERAYRKQLHRVMATGDSNLQYALWHQLGLLYRDDLQLPELAVEAFLQSARVRPHETEDRQILSQLYVTLQKPEDAARELQVLIRQDPTRAETFHSLYALYMQAGLFDRAWCAASVLVFLGQANPGQRALYEDTKPPEDIATIFQRIKMPINNEIWAKGIFHPDDDILIGKIFEMVVAAARQLKLQQLRASRQLPDLPADNLVNATTTIQIGRVFFALSQLLSLPAAPALYVLNDQPGTLRTVTQDPPASIAGADIVSGRSPLELLFLCAKHLSVYRPEHFVTTVFSVSYELLTLFFAALYIAEPAVALAPALADSSKRFAETLAPNIEPTDLENLRVVVRRFLDTGAPVDLHKWSHGVERTSIRAGLVACCGSLETAARLLRAEPEFPEGLPMSEKLAELATYAVSEQYFTVRRALGIANE